MDNYAKNENVTSHRLGERTRCRQKTLPEGEKFLGKGIIFRQIGVIVTNQSILNVSTGSNIFVKMKIIWFINRTKEKKGVNTKGSRIPVFLPFS